MTQMTFVNTSMTMRQFTGGRVLINRMVLVNELNVSGISRVVYVENVTTTTEQKQTWNL